MNLKDYQKGRNDGLAFAWKVVREGGAEALEKEIQMRGVTGIHVNLTQAELIEALEPIKDLTIRTVLAMSVATLRDEYGFGRERLQRFIDRFMQKTDCMLDNLVTWEDICKNIEEETGISLSFEGMPEVSGGI